MPDTTTFDNSVDYMNPNYSPEEVQAKLDQLYTRIDSSLNDDQINGIKGLLQELSQYGVGQRTIMEMPLDVRFSLDNKGYLKARDAGGVFDCRNKTILLPLEFDDAYYVLAIAHEMRHAIQYKNKLLHTHRSPFASDEFSQAKFCELETKLQDIVLGSQRNKSPKSAGSLFYEAERDRYLSAGLNQQEAEQKARESVTMVFWTGLHELPEGCSEITQGLKDEINQWTNTYDLQSFWECSQFAYSFKNIDNLLDEVKKAEEKEQQQAQYEEKQWEGVIERRNNALIPTYVKNMGIGLSEKWFLATQREKSTVGDNFLVNFYASGKIKDVIYRRPCGVTHRELSEPTAEHPTPIVLHEVPYDSHLQKDGTEIRRNADNQMISQIEWNDGLKDGKEIIHNKDYDKIISWRKGEKDGLEETHYKSGRLVKTNWKNGKKDGHEIHYNAQNQVTSDKNWFWQNGQQIAEETFYDEKYGYRGTRRWVDGEKCGLEEVHYKDGSVRKTYFEDGVENGPEEFFSPYGTVSVGNWENGRMVGDEKCFADKERTRLLYRIHYEGYHIASAVQYDENDEVIATYEGEEAVMKMVEDVKEMMKEKGNPSLYQTLKENSSFALAAKPSKKTTASTLAAFKKNTNGGR